MPLKNVAKGIKKLFISQLLSLFSYLLGYALSVIVLVGSMKDLIATHFVPLLLAASCVLITWFASLFLGFRGILLASKGETTFKKALFWFVLTLLLIALSAVFPKENTLLSFFVPLLKNACEAFSIYFILRGIGDLARQQKNKEIKNSCERTIRAIVCLQIISVLLSCFSVFLSVYHLGLESDTFTGSELFSYVGMLNSLLANIFFLVTLKKAKKLFAADTPHQEIDNA